MNTYFEYKKLIYRAKGKALNGGKQTRTSVTVTEGLVATDKGSFYNQKAWLEEYTYGEGLYYKGEHSNSGAFFHVESNYGESDSDS